MKLMLLKLLALWCARTAIQPECVNELAADMKFLWRHSHGAEILWISNKEQVKPRWQWNVDGNDQWKGSFSNHKSRRSVNHQHRSSSSSSSSSSDQLNRPSSVIDKSSTSFDRTEHRQRPSPLSWLHAWCRFRYITSRHAAIWLAAPCVPSIDRQ